MDMNNLRGVLGRLEQKDSALGDGGITADEIYTAASIAPVTGEAIAVKELPEDIRTIGELFSQGYDEVDFKKMGLGAAYTAAVALGIIPVAGVLGRMGKGVIKPLIKTAKNTDNFGALPTNVVNIPIRNPEIPKENIGALSNIKGDTVQNLTTKTLPANTIENFITQLQTKVIPNQNTAKLLKSENQEFIIDLEMGGAKDGIFESDWHKQAYENYKEIDNVLDKQIKNNEYPSKLNFSESATEQYNESLIDNIYDRFGVGEDVDLDIAQMWKDEFGVELTPSNMTNTDIRDAITTSAIDRQNLTTLPENVVEFPLTTRTIDTD